MRIIIASFCILLSTLCFSQEEGNCFAFNAGISVGGMNSITDLGGPKGTGNSYYLNEINWSNTQLSGGVFLATTFKNILGARIEYTIGSVKAYDSILRGANDPIGVDRSKRNLSFKSPVKSIALVGELYPINFLRISNAFPKFSPYVSVGIGRYSFNPKANYNGEWVELQPLHTEGQGFAEHPDRKPYSLNGTEISFGGGIAYDLPRFILKLELLHHRLDTDYLDDVSTTYIDPSLYNKYFSAQQAALATALSNRTGQPVTPGLSRGNPNNNDAYITFSLKLGFKFGGGNGGGGSKGMKCWAPK